MEIVSFKYGDSDSLAFAEYFDQDAIQQLNKFSGIQIQSNGNGLLSTGLIRGMGARHMAVVWNGWNIQSPINGTFDLSLLPRHGLALKLRTSPLSSVLGNASAAGGLLLKNKSFHDSHLQIGFLGETQENFDFYGNAAFNKNKVYGSIGFQSTRHKNRYRYKINDRDTTQRLADGESRNLQADITYKFNESVKTSLDFWHQSSDRNIPPTKTSTTTNARQKDENLRFSSKLNLKKGHWIHSLNLTHFDELIDYQSDLVDTSVSRNKVLGMSLISRMDKTNFRQYYGLSFRRDRVDASFYSEVFDRRQTAFWAMQEINFRMHWRIESAQRIEWIDKEKIVFVPSLKVAFQNGNFTTHYSINRTYQRPSFNDLYWPLGGNLELENESGWSQELGLEYKLWEESSYSTSISAKGFHIVSDNWIVWAPTNAGFWAPDNRKNVISKGFEIDLQTLWKSMALEGKIDLNYSYTSATISQDDASDLIGKTLLYIPNHKWNISSQIKYKDYLFSQEMNWVGKRFTNNDNSASIDPYMLVNISLSKEILLKEKNKLVLGIGIQNLLNRDYEVVKSYAMPLRYFQLKINYNLI